MSCGIYKITIGDHYYFGQSSDLVARRRAHHYSLKKQSHYNKHMQRCFDKYQEFSFEILLYCDEDNLDMYEQRLINTHIDDRKCMNISKRVGVYSRGHKVSEEEKIRIGKELHLTRVKPIQAILPDGSIRKWPSIRAFSREYNYNHRMVSKWLKGHVAMPGSAKSRAKKDHPFYKWVFSYVD